MKVLLVHPYVTSFVPNATMNEPLGLLSLATYLESTLGSEVDVKILDLFALGYDQCTKRGQKFVTGLFRKDNIIEYANNLHPDVIGITSNFTAYAEDSLEVAKILKNYFGDVPVVLGGAHVTMSAEEVLGDHHYIDYVVRGEGELTFYELINAIKFDGDIGSINGLSFRNSRGKVISNPDRELVSDINMLPIVDRKYVDMERYKKINSKSLAFTRNQSIATIMTSRGCPFDCIFCSTKVMWRRHWRPRSAENIVKEIEYLVTEYGINEIAIEDDQFVVNKKRVNEICDLIIERQINVTFSIPAGTSIWLVDFELLKKMKEVGFYRLCFPVETGSQKTLKFIRKPIDLAKVKETIKMAHSLGYWTQGNFIIGFPYETKEEIEQTIRFAYDSGLDYVFFFIAKPYAGADMYDIYKNEGLINNIVRSSHIERSDYDTLTLTAKELGENSQPRGKGFLDT